MSSPSEDALLWLNRAEEARIVADQLTDPAAKNAVMQVVQGYERLALAAAARANARREEATTRSARAPAANEETPGFG